MFGRSGHWTSAEDVLEAVNELIIEDNVLHADQFVQEEVAADPIVQPSPIPTPNDTEDS